MTGFLPPEPSQRVVPALTIPQQTPVPNSAYTSLGVTSGPRSTVLPQKRRYSLFSPLQRRRTDSPLLPPLPFFGVRLPSSRNAEPLSSLSLDYLSPAFLPLPTGADSLFLVLEDALFPLSHPTPLLRKEVSPRSSEPLWYFLVRTPYSPWATCDRPPGSFLMELLEEAFRQHEIKDAFFFFSILREWMRTGKSSLFSSLYYLLP